MSGFITYPLNDIEYEAQDAELYFSARKSGVFSLADFEIKNVTQLDITLGSGSCWISNEKFSGKVAALKESAEMQFSNGHSSMRRIDVIAVEFDKVNNITRAIVIEGTPSLTPQIPNITQTDIIYQLFLYAVTREAGEVSLNPNNIEDLRENRDFCGIMQDGNTHYIIDQNNQRLLRVWVGSKEEYDEIITKDSMTLYYVTDDTTIDDIINGQQAVGASLQSKYIEITNGNEIVFANESSGNNIVIGRKYKKGAGKQIKTYEFRDGTETEKLADVKAKLFVGNLNGKATTADKIRLLSSSITTISETGFYIIEIYNTAKDEYYTATLIVSIMSSGKRYVSESITPYNNSEGKIFVTGLSDGSSITLSLHVYGDIFSHYAINRIIQIANF